MEEKLQNKRFPKGTVNNVRKSEGEIFAIDMKCFLMFQPQKYPNVQD